MPGFLEPTPVVLFYFALKTFGYLMALLPLAAVRGVVSRGLSRWLSFAALGVALIGIAAQFGPAAAGIYTGVIYRGAFAVSSAGGGMVLPLLASLFLAASGLVTGARWRVVDFLHGALFATLVGAWWLAR